MGRFSDGRFLKADEKERILKHWTAFLRGGLRRTQFTDALYKHLTLHCSFIAHYNIDGFYAEYFVPESADAGMGFLAQFDRRRGCVSVELGMEHWVGYPDAADINGAMIEAAEPYLDGLYAMIGERGREHDVARADRLLAKHGIRRAD